MADAKPASAAESPEEVCAIWCNKKDCDCVGEKPPTEAEYLAARASAAWIRRCVAVILGGAFGVILADFMVDWPHPEGPLGVRIAGWVFFVGLGVVLAVAVEELA